MKKIHDRASTSTDARKSKPVANVANGNEAIAAQESAIGNNKHTPGEDDGTTFFRMNDASTSDASKEQDAI